MIVKVVALLEFFSSMLDLLPCLKPNTVYIINYNLIQVLKHFTDYSSAQCDRGRSPHVSCDALSYCHLFSWSIKAAGADSSVDCSLIPLEHSSGSFISALIATKP